MKTYHVTCSTDENYVQHCVVMLCSLMENNKSLHICVHLLYKSLSEDSVKLIRDLCERYANDVVLYDIDDASLRSFTISDNHKLTVACYYRLLLPSLLCNDIHRVLYLDCDIVVLKDIQELFDLDLGNRPLAAIPDATPVSNHHRFLMGLGIDEKAFCSGVMMINLDYWRNNCSQERMLKFATVMGDSLIMEDQDILNHEFRGKWLQLPYKYGKTPLSVAVLDTDQRMYDILEYVNDPSILHYSAKLKPWLNVWFPDRHYYLDYLAQSGFPNPKFIAISSTYRRKVYLDNVRFYINRYVHPLVPDLIEMVLVDVLNICKIVAHLVRPSLWRGILVKRWLDKYKQ